MPDQTPSGDTSRLEAGWRDRISSDVLGLAAAWREPDRLERHDQGGLRRDARRDRWAGGPRRARRARWDLAVSTGQDFTADDASLEGVYRRFLAMISGPGNEEQRGDAFRPERPVTATAPLLERVLALAGRDINWER